MAFISSICIRSEKLGIIRDDYQIERTHAGISNALYFARQRAPDALLMAIIDDEDEGKQWAEFKSSEEFCAFAASIDDPI